MNPRAMANRFRIWQFCEPRGWDVTAYEVAEALGLNPRSVANICRYAGWTERLRVNPRSLYSHEFRGSAECTIPGNETRGEDVLRLVSEAHMTLDESH